MSGTLQCERRREIFSLALFDDAVGLQQHPLRYRQPHFLGGFQIDHWLFHGRLAGLRPSRSEATRHAKNSDVPLLSLSHNTDEYRLACIVQLLKFGGDIVLILNFPYAFVSFLLTNRFGRSQKAEKSSNDN